MTDIDQLIFEHIEKVIPALKQCDALNISLETAKVGEVELKLPYHEKLIGNLETRVINGGALTTLLDTVCAFAAVSALGKPTIAPTLDLRIDYMRPATPDLDIIGKAEAYRVTNNVIFARGQAFHREDSENPVAVCTATFMRLDQKNLQGDRSKMPGHDNEA